MSADQPTQARRVLVALSEGLFIVATAAAGTALLILLVVLGHDLIRTGSAADWIAAIANVAMAITAVLAFVVARSWLPQLTTQEGYKLAIQLVNTDVLALGEDNPLKRDVRAEVEKFTRLNEREQRISGETVLKDLKAIYERAEKQVKAIQKLQDQMATYGLAPAPDRAVAFKAMVQALKQFVGRARAQWVLLTVTARGGIDSGSLQDLTEMDTHAMISKLAAGTEWIELSAEELRESDGAWAQMVENQKAFLGSDSRIGKLFTVHR
ncbi:hypothetical protein ABRP55_11795 [Pectobacterium zantedeschiae]|uniref:hypothetical protein n=1 Tax=Pectobacterium zantedeschiae TaxID=2034769 RepID=UPI0032F019FA